MGAAAPAVLDVRGLTIALPSGADRALAVDRAGFSVNASEIVCLVGESGSGKSVIAQATMGLLPAALRATGGQVLLDGGRLVHGRHAKGCYLAPFIYRMEHRPSVRSIRRRR